VTAYRFNQVGGSIAEAFLLAISAPTGSIYYTLNGGDPRQTNLALLYSAPVTLPANAVVKARALSIFQ